MSRYLNQCSVLRDIIIILMYYNVLSAYLPLPPVERSASYTTGIALALPLPLLPPLPLPLPPLPYLPLLLVATSAGYTTGIALAPSPLPYLP